MAQPPQYPILYRATADYPLFGVWRGDVVRYDPTRAPSIVVVRYLPPNHGGLLLAVEDGILTQISADPSVVPLHPPVGPRVPPPPQSTRPARVIPLRLETA
jgi:hypothetical protein